MGLPKLAPGERVRADMTSPPGVLLFPFLEAVVTTGLVWMAVGYLDGPWIGVDRTVRNALVALWAVLLVLRFLLPVVKERRRRFIVTDRRIIARAPTLRSRVDSIPLRDVHSVRRYRGGISVAVFGLDRALHFPSVPRGKKIEGMIQQALSGRAGFYQLPRR